jgi:hypothetical protein
MWNEENNRFFRSAVPKSFDRAVDRLQNRDSVIFESISLPSLVDHGDVAPGRPRTPPTHFYDPLFDVGRRATRSDIDVTIETPGTDPAFLLDRIKELERENAQKDKEITALHQQLQKLRHTSKIPIHNSASDDAFYKDQYEALKFQYDKLREALVVSGKLKKVRVKSSQMRRL